MHRLYATVTFVLLLGFSGGASAQLSDQKLAEINRVAMEAYNNLDIETSKKALEDAIRGAERSNTHGPGLARTYSNLGVVVVGGLGDSSTGIDAFMRALKEDPNVEPDPLVSTPEVMTAFNAAKRKVASGAAPRPAAAAAPAPVESGPVEGNLSHTPAEEQLSQTAVPVFVSKGSVEVAKLKIFYRSLGMSKPKSAEMQKTDEGWMYLIPCTDVFEPSVEYFINAEDEDGDQVGNAGTPEHPVVVPVVSTRTQEAPSLPGQEPPVQCNASTECPPGMPGCSGGGSGQMGDTCRSRSDCSSGLSCVDEFCSLSSGDEEEEDDKDSGDAPKWHLDVGFGAGAVYLGEGKEADRPPSVALVSEAQNRQLMGTGDPHAYLVSSGWDCELSPTPPLAASNCKVAVKKKGFVPTLILNFALGRYISPKLAVALTGRIQLEHGEGPLAGLVLGGRGEYLVTTPAADGFHLGLTAGVGVGSIQARPPADSKGGPFATSAVQGGVGVVLGLGLRAGYRFTRNFGFQVSPGLSMGLPRFLMAIDLHGGLELAY